jgi:hypothetical protein
MPTGWVYQKFLTVITNRNAEVISNSFMQIQARCPAKCN